MGTSGRPPLPASSSLVSDRLILRPVPWDAVLAITAGKRLDDWAPDYPSDGDVVLARLLPGADEAGVEPAGQAGAADQAGAEPADQAGLGQAGRAGVEPADQAWGHRQVVERSSGLAVGGIGFFGPPQDGEVEIGYGIVPSRQGRGYATEALQAMTEMAWADARVRTVVAGTDPGNVASQRVLEKAGFRRITAPGEFRYQLTRPA